MTPLNRRQFVSVLCAAGAAVMPAAGLLRAVRPAPRQAEPPPGDDTVHLIVDDGTPAQWRRFLVTEVSGDGNCITVELREVPELGPVVQLSSWPPANQVPGMHGNLTLTSNAGLQVRPGDVVQMQMGWRAS